MATIKFPGSKPEIKVDIEKLKFCETLADETIVEFIRVFRYENGILTNTTDVQIDGSTPYVVIDEANVKSCEDSKLDQCFLTKKWVFEIGSIPAGVTEKLWELDNSTNTGFGIPGGGVSSPTLIPNLFTDRDECGVYVHPNDSDAIVSILPQAVPTDTSSASVTNQNELDFWLCVDQPGIKVNARVNGFSSYSVWFGGCNEKLQLIEDGINTTAAGNNFIDIPLGILPQGFFHVRLYSNDPSSFGKTILQWDSGNGFEDIPTENLISDKPSATCVELIYNKTQQKYVNLDGTDFDESANKCFACDPCDAPTGFPEPVQDISKGVEQKILCDKALTGEVTKFIRHTVYNADGTVSSEYDTTIDATAAYTASGIVDTCDKTCGTRAMWNEVIDVTDAAPVALDLSNVNAGTDYCDVTCAQIQITGGTAFYTVNHGSEPGNGASDPAGFRIDDCGIIEIGCCGNGKGNKDELSDFRIIAEDGETVQLRITYYRPEN